MVKEIAVGDKVRIVGLEGQTSESVKLGGEFVVERVSEGKYVDGPYASSSYGTPGVGGVYLKNLVVIPKVKVGDTVRVLRQSHVSPEGELTTVAHDPVGTTFVVTRVEDGAYTDGGYVVNDDTVSGPGAWGVYFDMLEVVEPEPVFEVGDHVEIVGYFDSTFWAGPAVVTSVPSRSHDYPYIEVKKDRDGVSGSFYPKHLKLVTKAADVAKPRFAVGETVQVINAITNEKKRLILSVKPSGNTFVYRFEGGWGSRLESELEPLPAAPKDADWKFKLGEKITCIEAGSGVKKGRAYIVLDGDADDNFGGRVLTVEDAETGEIMKAFELRFSTYVEPEPEYAPKFKVGDWVQQTKHFNRVFQVEEIQPLNPGFHSQNKRGEWGNFYVAGNGVSAWENFVELTENPRKVELEAELAEVAAKKQQHYDKFVKLAAKGDKLKAKIRAL